MGLVDSLSNIEKDVALWATSFARMPCGAYRSLSVTAADTKKICCMARAV